jgi:hypothetical protein
MFFHCGIKVAFNDVKIRYIKKCKQVTHIAPWSLVCSEGVKREFLLPYRRIVLHLFFLLSPQRAKNISHNQNSKQQRVVGQTPRGWAT